MDKIRQALNEFWSWRWKVRGPKGAEGEGLKSARQGRGLSAVAMQGSRSTCGEVSQLSGNKSAKVTGRGAAGSASSSGAAGVFGI
jgi:hypothetical protein